MMTVNARATLHHTYAMDETTLQHTLSPSQNDDDDNDDDEATTARKTTTTTTTTMDSDFAPPLLPASYVDGLRRMRFLPAGQYSVIRTTQSFSDYIPCLHRHQHASTSSPPPSNSFCATTHPSPPPPPPLSTDPLTRSVRLLHVEEFNQHVGSSKLYARQITAEQPSLLRRKTLPLPTLSGSAESTFAFSQQHQRLMKVYPPAPTQQRHASLRNWWTTYQARRQQQKQLEPQQQQQHHKSTTSFIGTPDLPSLAALSNAATPIMSQQQPSSFKRRRQSEDSIATIGPSPSSSSPSSPSLQSSSSPQSSSLATTVSSSEPKASTSSTPSVWATINSSSVRIHQHDNADIVQCGQHALLQAVHDGLISLAAIEAVPIDWQDLAIDYYRQTSVLEHISDADHSLPAANPLFIGSSRRNSDGNSNAFHSAADSNGNQQPQTTRWMYRHSA